MRQLGRFVLLATVACALAAAGCTSGPDQGDAPVRVRYDPAFTADKLRAIDPCGLLDHDTLHSQGTSSTGFAGTPSGFDNCSLDMRTFHHSDLTVSVMVGGRASTVGSRSVISGMAVLEEPNSGECAELILSPEQKISIEMQVQTEYSSCAIAREITTAMIDHIRTNPPKRQVPAGSLGTLDPCGTVDGPGAAAAIGPASPAVRRTLYTCEWDARPLDLSVAFWVGDARVPGYGQATPQPVDLGGVTGYQVLIDKQSCQIGWNVRPTGAPHQFELVYVEVENLGVQQVDMCAKTLVAAKAVLTKVPKPS